MTEQLKTKHSGTWRRVAHVLAIHQLEDQLQCFNSRWHFIHIRNKACIQDLAAAALSPCSMCMCTLAHSLLVMPDLLGLVLMV